MNDDTESIRRLQLVEVNAEPGSREVLEAEHGQVWDTQQLRQDFTVEGFLAPYAIVRRRSDGQRGSLLFQASPRFYFSFEAYTPPRRLKCVRVEYDLGFWGGDYSGVGEFVCIPHEVIDRIRGKDTDRKLRTAFTVLVGDPRHIIHYTWDEPTDQDGNEWEV